MKKQELISAIAEQTGLTKAVVTEVLGGFESVVFDTLKADGEVTLGGLVKFHTADVAERTYPNPQGGAPVVKPAHKQAKVKALSGLKNLLD